MINIARRRSEDRPTIDRTQIEDGANTERRWSEHRPTMDRTQIENGANTDQTQITDSLKKRSISPTVYQLDFCISNKCS
ncbi:hypothetical protein SAMN05661012_02914 [Chitinophaga sancti]|uniref:Uncharacterized protein n=1 Tax=Chitinophaga sancti TaxID=1004 RepID=A0A1K1QMJ3_9BACT|nr:hypothetical protein SAMN05661012_02914 [Chitinophaga sancti]